MNRRDTARTCTFLGAMMIAWASALGAASAQQSFDADGASAMLARINELRQQSGASPLARDSQLDSAAQLHCSDMARNGALSHVSEATGTPSDRVRQAGVQAGSVAENVALHRSAADAMEALIGSEAHRTNLLNPSFNRIGLAALQTASGTYVTQVFATVAAPAPAAVAEAPAPVAPVITTPSLETSAAAPAAAVTVPAPVASPELPAGVVEQGPLPTVIGGPGVGSTGLAQAQINPGAGVGSQAVQPPAQLQQNGQLTVVQRTAGRVAGYWIYSGTRWWYFPMPPDAQPGQRLTPDLSRVGPPPGYPEHPSVGQRPAIASPTITQPTITQPMPPPVYQPAPPVYQPPPVAASVAVRPNGGSVTINPGAVFYAVPPPPFVAGRPARAFRRAHRVWNRAYRHWLRQQRTGAPRYFVY